MGSFTPRAVNQDHAAGGAHQHLTNAGTDGDLHSSCVSLQGADLNGDVTNKFHFQWPPKVKGTDRMTSAAMPALRAFMSTALEPPCTLVSLLF